ncbi:uncharacterized protein LOC124623009 [Schistocerca americana]|uniref:uncharacterized protein LOC124623009 n=1 Tax=Schistocerca americana TaxID=7009 RepID=UPI001F4FE400|nr:uncharacterized protein LOC124623009 [Schistocerca americana]
MRPIVRAGGRSAGHIFCRTCVSDGPHGTPWTRGGVAAHSALPRPVPEDPIADPDFTDEIRNATVAVGREAVLSCPVSNLGPYKVGWLRAEDQTVLALHDKVVTHNARITVSHDGERTWRLHIRQVKETDRGCYMCQINTSVMKKQLGCLDVLGE